jgi:predicted nucleic acid-binding protein
VGWLDDLDGRVVGLDTTPLIYFLEARSPHYPLVRAFFRKADRGDFSVVTSMVTVLEVLVHPWRTGNTALATRYRNILLRNANLATIPLSAAIADRAANLRARYNLSTPDAVQVATALTEGASHFLTNDARLARVSDIRVLVLDDLA